MSYMQNIEILDSFEVSCATECLQRQIMALGANGGSVLLMYSHPARPLSLAHVHGTEVDNIRFDGDFLVVVTPFEVLGFNICRSLDLTSPAFEISANVEDAFVVEGVVILRHKDKTFGARDFFGNPADVPAGLELAQLLDRPYCSPPLRALIGQTMSFSTRLFLLHYELTHGFVD
jgi:hypothetical protein